MNKHISLDQVYSVLNNGIEHYREALTKLLPDQPRYRDCKEELARLEKLATDQSIVEGMVAEWNMTVDKQAELQQRAAELCITFGTVFDFSSCKPISGVYKPNGTVSPADPLAVKESYKHWLPKGLKRPVYRQPAEEPAEDPAEPATEQEAV